MPAKMSLLFLASTLVLAMTPVSSVAQEALSHADEPEHSPAAEVEASDTGTVLATLRLSSEYAALLAPPSVNLPTDESQRSADDEAPAVPAAPSKGSGTGLGFMIGGAAALVGGLLIGGTGGNIIAAGGVALGVYGAIVYF